MNDSNLALVLALEASLAPGKFNRHQRRKARALANLAQRRGVLRPEVVPHLPRCYALAMSELARAARKAGEPTTVDPAGKPTLSLGARLAAKARTAAAMTKAALVGGVPK